METDITFDKVTVAACDQIIDNLMKQSIPVSDWGKMWKEVNFWRAVRYAKARQEIGLGSAS
ncbi:hypothetical protein [Bombella pollinis]|uniref:Uncharacterized protein n=1 Tax=Bombella pollinis TaxID=2967337 RepID=A0ABT3WTC3_9PROT|nr:hypothetical protein [Bombella pollinis]MCX5620111.1 hypothetical protein [Bombella pollinis]